MKITRYLIGICFLFSCIEYASAQYEFPDTTLSFSFSHQSLEECLVEISNSTGLLFAYKTSLIDTIRIREFNAQNQGIEELLNSFLGSCGLNYIVRNHQIFLRKKPDSYFFQGHILSQADSLPIPYASLSLKGKPVGTITDYKGIFEWELSNRHMKDTIVISSMGYAKLAMSVQDLLTLNRRAFYLSPEIIEIDPIVVHSKNFRQKTMGNNGNRETGSIYIDTHGQQTALHITNSEEDKGQLLSVSFFLSEEGNTAAPFRVRIYETDTSTGRPGKDVLDEILVVKPTGADGWYEIPLHEYHLEFPTEGLFVALMGIFPNDYEFYAGSEEFIDISDKTINTPITAEEPLSVSYGQRLGYNRREAENTWHYSLSHTWFQLRKQQYGVLIQAEVQFDKPSGGFFHNWFSKNEKDE